MRGISGPLAPLQAFCISFVLASSIQAGRMYIAFLSSTLIKVGLIETHTV